jgi:lysophospholipase L1-like esterase
VSTSAGRGGLLFEAGQKILCIGDSITDCGRRQEAYAPYGRGYVALLQALLPARYPALGLEVVNRGIGGNTVRDLAGRWEADVVAERPAWLSIMIGVNDAWGAFYGRQGAVLLDEYERTYRELLAQARAATGAQLILMEPFVVTPPAAGDPAAAAGMDLEAVRREYPPLRQRGAHSGREVEAAMIHARGFVEPYAAVARTLAAEFDAVLVRTQTAFDDALQAQPRLYWAPDGVHPTSPGHALIARAWLRAAGYGDV